MSASSRPSVDQLKRAIKISEQIQSLEAELAAILNKTGASVPIRKGKAAGSTRKKPVISEEGKARIAAAQRARWARQKKAAKAAAKAAS